MAERRPEPPEVTQAARERVTTPLLTLITQQSLDEDYRQVAERRALDPGASRPRRPHWTAAVVVAAFGLLVTLAAVQTSRQADVQSASRSTLISRVESGRDHLGDLQRRIVAMRETNVALQDRLDEVDTEAQAAEARNRRLEAITGFLPVTGPGVRVTVDDAPDGVTTVRDRDLRLAVNGLWEAGAEAIAINGQRLTARSAIRNSSITIRINARSLSPPYVIEAIGDDRSLQADLMDTTTGLAFRDLVRSLGFPWSMDNVDDLSLPAAPSRLMRLRYADSGTAQENLHQRRKEPPP